MIQSRKFLSLLTLFGAAVLFSSACSDSNNPVIGDDSDASAQYFLGIEAAADPEVTDVLTLGVASLDTGSVSPENNGYEQPAWMTFIQGEDQIFATGYTSAPEFVSYELVNGQLTKGESFFTDLGTYAYDVVDESTLVMVGNARSGLNNKKIYLVDTDAMSIMKTVETNFGDNTEDSLFAFPSDMKVRGDKLFISYYLVEANGSFKTPDANEARLSVFSYPELEFEKEIVDDRAANIGRYITTNALEIDEIGDIYTFSPSSLTSGYNPVPANNSAILRVKKDETEFDENFYIDFETLSGGYKLHDLFYVANGKAVVRIAKEDETDEAYYWEAYTPNSETPVLETGIIDLYNNTFTLLDNVPNGGGGWNAAYLVEGTKVYLGVSNSTYAGIYVIDTETETATEGATVEGNYAKAILSLSEEE